MHRLDFKPKMHPFVGGGDPLPHLPPLGTACQQMAAMPPSWSLLFHTWSLLLQMLTKTLLCDCHYFQTEVSTVLHSPVLVLFIIFITFHKPLNAPLSHFQTSLAY